VSELIEVRWHGRGGQGAKTAALLLAEAAIEEGMHGQGFPEYGPERTGAPMRGFTRISDKPILMHCAVENPKFVLVLDQTLLEAVNVLEGVPEDGVIIVNTPKSVDEIRKQLNVNGQTVYTLNASQIAQETIGRPIPNTVMLGALVSAVGMIPIDRLVAGIEKKFSKKFAKQIVDSNITAIRRAYKEVSKG